MTNPNPLIITNKFPSWIIQDKNQPPSWPSRPASDRLGLIYFCFLAETSIPPFYPNTRTRNTLQEPSRQTNGQEGTDFIFWEKGDKRREWLMCAHRSVSLSSVMCHLTCVISGAIIVSSWHHPDITETLTHILCHQLTPLKPGPGARLLKYFESDEEHIFTRPSVFVELLPGWLSWLPGARVGQ